MDAAGIKLRVGSLKPKPGLRWPQDNE